MQWLSFRQRQLEALYLEHFAQAYRAFDLTSIVVHVALTLAWLGRYGRNALPRVEIIADVALLVFHFALLVIALLDPALAKRHRHDVIALDRIVIFVMMGHAQWRLIEIEGARGNWEPVVVNVLGWGTGSMLVWSACLHRLPYNRSVCLSLLQLCVLMLQNGPIIFSMQRHFGAKLDVGSRVVNETLRWAVGAWWPDIPGIVYFAVFFCCVRQVAFFFLAVWLAFKFELTLRRSFLAGLGMQPSEATEFNNMSYIESVFLSCNVIGIAAMVSLDMLGLYRAPNDVKTNMKQMMLSGA